MGEFFWKHLCKSLKLYKILDDEYVRFIQLIDLQKNVKKNGELLAKLFTTEETTAR